MKRPNWHQWVQLAVAFGVLAWLVWRYEEQIAEVIRRPKNWGWFVLAIGLCATAALLTFYRWYLLVWAQGLPFRVADAIRLGFLGYLFNFVMPGLVGGDLVKAYLIARQQSHRTVAVATVFMDRFLGLVALFYVGAVVSILFWPRFRSTAELRMPIYVLWALAAGATGLMAIMLTPAIYRWRWVGRLTTLPAIGRIFTNLFQALLIYRQKLRVIVLVTAMSIVCHIGFIGSFYCVARALHGETWYPNLLEHYLIMPLGLFIGSVVPLPGGAGATEGSVAWLYGLLGPETIARKTAEGRGLANSLAYRAVQLLIAAVGAVFYLRRRREISQVLEQPENRSPLTPQET